MEKLFYADNLEKEKQKSCNEFIVFCFYYIQLRQQ